MFQLFLIQAHHTVGATGIARRISVGDGRSKVIPMHRWVISPSSTIWLREIEAIETDAC
jgi:hypothetical protein